MQTLHVVRQIDHMKHMHLADVSIRCSNPPQGKINIIWAKGRGGGGGGG